MITHNKTCIYYRNSVDEDDNREPPYSIWLYFGCRPITELRKTIGNPGIGKSPYYESDEKFNLISFRLKAKIK